MLEMVKEIKLDMKKRTERKQQSLERLLGKPRGSSMPRTSIMVNHNYGSSKAVTMNASKTDGKGGVRLDCKAAFKISKDCKQIIAGNSLIRREFDFIKEGARENLKEIYSAMESKAEGNRQQVIERVQRVLDQLRDANVVNS